MTRVTDPNTVFNKIRRAAPRSPSIAPIVTMTFTARTVSRSFREALKREIPGLGENRSYWRLIQYLLFGTWRDEESRHLMLPTDLLAAIEEKRNNQHYEGYKFLRSFMRDTGIKIEIVPHVFTYDPSLWKPRMVKGLTLPDPVAELVHIERCSVVDERVFMDSGTKWLRKHGSALRSQELLEANAAPSPNPCDLSVRLRDYMNDINTERFGSILSHLPKAVKIAEGLKDSENQLNILRGVHDQPKPIYTTVEYSTRIFATNDSVLRLHRDVRKVLTQDWITADLRSAQLAIVAKVWDVPEIKDYLAAGASIWPDLCTHMGVPFTPDHKATMKRALYAITFGAGRRKMHSLLAEDFNDGRNAYDRFRWHKVIRAMLIARSRQLKMIRNMRGSYDAFGRFLPLRKKAKEGYWFLFDNARSILACIAQSYELLLLQPVIDAAFDQKDRRHGFKLMTWLHDGFTLLPNCRGDEELWKQRLSDLVKIQAKDLGIVTELEF